MLTRRGFVKASDLKKGDELLYDLRSEFSAWPSGKTNFEYMPMVEDVFEAIVSSGVPGRSVVASSDDLHGDAAHCYGKVETINPAGRLSVILDPCGIERFSEQVLPFSDADLEFVASISAHNLGLGSLLYTASGGMRRDDLSPSLALGHAAPFDALLFGRASQLDASIEENARDNSSAGFVSAADCQNPIAGLIGGLDCFQGFFRWEPVLEVHEVAFSGWAFDCSTESQLYNSDGFIVHNCRCTFASASEGE
jgi:hypothetical protein